MHRMAWLLLLAGTFAAAQADLGYRLHPNQVSRKASAECLTSPSQTFPCVENIEIGGTHFDVIEFDDKRVVRYLFTTDPSFATKNGFHVGDWITVSERDVLLIPGWHILGPRTPDGWRTVLGYDTSKVQPPHFADGAQVNLVRTAENEPHLGKLRIIGFEKGSL